jgi:hypothetical protein
MAKSLNEWKLYYNQTYGITDVTELNNLARESVAQDKDVRLTGAGLPGTTTTGSSAYSVLTGSTTVVGPGGVSTGKVYLGPGNTTSAKNRPFDVTSDKTDTVDNQIAEYYKWDTKQRDAFQKEMNKLGYDASFEKLPSIWALAVNDSSRYYTASNGKTKITPQDILKLYAPSKNTGPSVSISVQNVDPATLDKRINSSLQDLLGRNASDEEKAKIRPVILSMLQKGTKTVTTRSGNVSKSVTTPAVSDAMVEQKITEFAKETSPEDYQRQKAFGFNSEMKKILSGGM